ncbi:MAG: PEGA domain-containing protein [Candidatus Sericytochromatia bacterium]|nr:PEGA domain-containing protein [Candidatus Tanganyikabacteria bacterium]
MQAAKSCFRFLALLVALALSWNAPAAAAGADPGWDAAIAAAARGAATPPDGVTLRSLAVADIREGRTLALWPLSARLEADLAAAVAARKPGFEVLGHPQRADLGAAGRTPGAGKDGVLTGTYRASGADIRFDLVVRDLQGRGTLYALAPVVVAEAALPPGSLPAAGFGRLAIEVDPPGALVFLDGEPVGKGSLSVAAPIGPHLITVAAEGYEVFDETVDVATGAAAHVVAKLKRPSVTVTIEASVPGAAVAIDGVDRGTTPISLSGLAAGKHRVTVTREGYRPYEAEFDWAGGRTQVVRATLVPIPGSLVVTADVGDARVEVDDRDVGRAPVHVADLPPGSHKVRVTAGARTPFEQTVEVRTARTAHLRARLGADAGTESDFRGLAVVPRSAAAADRALALAVQRNLQEVHPEVVLADPVEGVRMANALFPEEGGDDPDLVRKVAQGLQARQVAVVGAGSYEPFAFRWGVWPTRPTLRADVRIHQGTGPRQSVGLPVAFEGGEAWLGSGDRNPDREALLPGLAANVASALAGKPARPLEIPGAPPLIETLSAFTGNTRAGLGFGLLYEVRALDFLEFGAGLAYANALGNDFKSGSRLTYAGAGNDLVYGVGQHHQLRVDALWRFDGPPRPRGPWFDAPRLAPYVGLGARVNVPRYEVYGVNRKDPEGGYYATEPRGSLLGGTKVSFGGLVLRAELEFPVVATIQDKDATTLTLAGGWVF